MRDVFYYNNKPNAHPREKYAKDFAEARALATTEHFWIINEYCDYRNFDWDFDFEFLPDEDVWAIDHINVWPSNHQKDSGTWLCNTDNDSPVIIYRNDVDIIKRKTDVVSDNWIIHYPIDRTKFDLSWHHDPNDPSYIYVWGNQHHDAIKMPTVEYVVPGATRRKYIENAIAPLVSDITRFQHLENAVLMDYSWTPDPDSPPYIYAWGNQWNKPEDKISIQYVVEGATQYRYMKTRAIRNVCMDNWVIPDNIDTSTFDFSWEPGPDDIPYIYQFGTQHQRTGGPRYITPGSDKIKYLDCFTATSLPNPDEFMILNDYKIKEFDFSWHPDNTEEPFIYVFGNKYEKAEVMPTVQYVVPGATQVKYINDICAILDDDMSCWDVPENIDCSNIDFGWKPNPHEPPFIYQFGTQHQRTGGPKYIAPGADGIKYVEDPKAKYLPNIDDFVVVDGIKIREFDYSWHPDDTDDPYIYVFGNTQYPAEVMPTIRYEIPGATQIKYVTDTVARLDIDMAHWDIPDNVDITTFDFSWKPHPHDPPFIYQFGTQHQRTGGPKYIAPGADRIKYVDGFTAKILPDMTNWYVPDNVDVTTFDFSWHPDATADPYIYQFGTQWQKTGGPKYSVPEGTDYKYIDVQTIKILPDLTNWYIRNIPVNWDIPDKVDVTTFDFSWHPDATSDPCIYQFGTQLDKEDGPKYITPGTTTEYYITYLFRVETKLKDTVEEKEITVNKYYIETTLEDLVNQHKNELFWALNPDIDYTNFDFSWRPGIDQVQYMHAFGTKDNLDTQTYFVNAVSWKKGFRDINYIEAEIKLKAVLDIFFVDRGNKDSEARFKLLKSMFGNRIQKTRYLNSWVDTINRCINRATSNLCWILNSEIDYTNFDFDYYPNTWQMKMIHVFGTQWSHWGNTYLINRETFSSDTKYIKIIEHLSNLNFVKHIRANSTECLYDVLLIDHGNNECNSVFEQIQNKILDKRVTVINYDQGYINTLQAFVKNIQKKKEQYFWVCSSVCDYKDFDFTYICDPFAKENLHVFPSGIQKFGDTFLVNANSIGESIDKCCKINYNNTLSVSRLPEPIISTTDDTLVNAALEDYNWPYVTLLTSDNTALEKSTVEPLNLWSDETKNIVITSTGASRIVVPREVKNHVKNELYDYPHIKKLPKLAKSNPLDIVFLSNGEKCADENYEHLLKVTDGLKNRVVRVSGIKGRANAYHAAVEASNTPWAFTVFAKLRVDNKFDWNWQPDRMQLPKHYIFHAKNPVNGLIYGHQAMIAYNKKLTLANDGNRGLDFTLDDEHEVVEILSGVAMYNTDPFSTWRTAFREVLKLRAENTEISKIRLEAWTSIANGNVAEYSIKGANDALQYYDEVNGDYNSLKLSYEWDWLRERFNESRLKMRDFFIK